MEREFTVSTLMKIVYGLLAAVIFIFSIFLFTSYDPSKGNGILIVPFLMLIGAVSIVISLLKRRVTISDNNIVFVNLISKTELAFADIKGYRVGRKVIFLEPISADHPTMIIRNYIDFGDSAELVDWIKGTFADLDGTDYEAEKSRITQDTNLGFTTEEREQKLDNAKKIAVVYNVAGVIVAIAVLVINQPWVTVAAIVYPLLSVPVILTSNGLIKLMSNRKRSVYPFLIIGFAAPAVVLLAKAVSKHHLLNTDSLWVPVLGLGLAVFVLLFKVGLNKSMGSIAAQIAALGFVSLLYAFASIIEINCEFDQSPVKVYQATVLGHHISHGKNTSYYLYLTTWGPCNKQEQIDVGSKMYDNTNIGDTVNIDFKPGLLNISWFVLAKR